MRLSHLPLTDAGYPGMTKRSGKPFSKGKGTPFISQAINPSASSAFAMGTPREIGTLLASPLTCGSAP